MYTSAHLPEWALKRPKHWGREPEQAWVPRLSPLEKGGALGQPSQAWPWEIKVWAMH